MKFKTKNDSKTVTSVEHLSSLISSAMRNKATFLSDHGSNRFLKLAAYSDEGLLVELHRGKKWSGWISPPLSDEQAVREVFLEYYTEGDLSDDRLNRDDEWMEIEGLHPAVYIIAGIIIIGAVVYFSFFNNS